MALADPALQLIGREAELEAIRRVLDRHPGTSSVGIVGAAGSGKTTLWQAAIDAARALGWTVLATRPSDADASLSFAGLIDLLGPVAEPSIAGLPPPQREAIRAALLREAPRSARGAGAIAVGLLGVLADLAARTGRVLVAVDDLHWLDRPSLRALEFALRRLAAAPIAVAFTHRPDDRAASALVSAIGPDRVEPIELGPLSVAAVYQLVRQRTGRALPRPLLLRIHEASGGNPLYALELARALLDRADLVGPHDPLPVPPRLVDLVRARLRRLPARTRALLLLAAAMPAPTVAAIRAAVPAGQASRLDIDLEPAESAGVVEIVRGQLRFTHPLLASVVYEDAGAPARRRAHLALAGRATLLEERARHLALATLGPDEAVAVALDDAVDDLVGRGAAEAAFELADRSVGLTPPEDTLRLARRLARAGSLAATVGDHARARDRLEAAAEALPAGLERAAVLLELADLVPLADGLTLCDRALEHAGDDAVLGSRIHRTRGSIAYGLGRVEDAEREAALAVELAERAGDPEAIGAAIGDLAHWAFCAGRGVRRDLFERAIRLNGSAGSASPRRHLAKVLMDAGRLAEARPMLEELLAASLRNGDLRSAAVHLLHLGELEVWAGNWQVAIERVEESLLIRQHTNQPAAPLYVKAMALACLGRLEEAREVARAGLAQAERGGDLVAEIQNLHALGFAALSVADFEAAQPLLARATELHRPRWRNEFGDNHCVPDDVEASLGIGDLDRARELVAWLQRVASATGRAWTGAMAARSRGLVLAAEGRLDEAELALTEALRHHERMELPFARARTMLHAGIVLRRRRKRARAAGFLRDSRAAFDALGASVWAARAAGEIERLGVRSVAQRGLTPVEAEIAGLVAAGLTNREIADRLFLSPKTVEANLSRIYRKLDLRSRAELVASLASGPGAAAG
ncbi:MAG TPA: AAA family ATPase [Candidatus Limnocylindrales bacterium]|nr:AAA family ATPase [Candidatus Limnocylindrales bacterium]